MLSGGGNAWDLLGVVLWHLVTWKLILYDYTNMIDQHRGRTQVSQEKRDEPVRSLAFLAQETIAFRTSVADCPASSS